MIKIKAKLELFKDGRKTPFTNGYRPMFNFINEMKVSGKIELINKSEFYPGESSEVIIYFLNNSFLGDNFTIGTKFTFTESESILGKGEVLLILDN